MFLKLEKDKLVVKIRRLYSAQRFPKHRKEVPMLNLAISAFMHAVASSLELHGDSKRMALRRAYAFQHR